MKVVVTGAAGFIGAALIQRLRADPSINRITAVDLHELPGWANDTRVRFVGGSIADAAVLRLALDDPPSLVFHLASIPGGKAEAEYELARAVNFGATERLVDLLSAQSNCPVVVFASSIATLGGPLPALVDDNTPASPLLSYGAQKLMAEVLIADSSRRGSIDGRSLRLCGVVTRPPQPTGAISIFFSDLLRDLPQGKPVTVPMQPDAETWLMSLDRCLDNLLHAATIDPSANPRRVWTPPPLHMTMAGLVDAIGTQHGQSLAHLVSYRPNPVIEASFGRFPPFRSVLADQAGLRSDGTLAAMVRRATP